MLRYNIHAATGDDVRANDTADDDNAAYSDEVNDDVVYAATFK